MENARIAKTFDKIADLLELHDENPYRIRSYRNAASSIRSLSDQLTTRIKQDQDLTEIPNIGESIAEKIHEIVETGHCRQLDSLQKQVPKGLPALLKVPGLGPRKSMQLSKELHIHSLAALEKACKRHKIQKLDGFGSKTEQKILHGIMTVKRTKGRILYRSASGQLQRIGQHLDTIGEIDRWEVAGSFRRGKETIGDLDILIHAKDREAAADRLVAYEEIDHVIRRGQERISIRLGSGLQVDFRFFDTKAFGSAWMYFTGSKAHNVHMRRIAQEKGWKLNEYGLFKNTSRLAGKTEKTVYQRLDMDWVHPALREDRGEIEAAQKGKLPVLVQAKDIRGDLQSHTTASDGKHTIQQMARAAKDYSLDYLAITDHSKRVTMANGLDDTRARKHADAIRKIDAEIKHFWLLAGIEVDVLKSGKLDLSEKTLSHMDWVVASIHYDREMSRKAMTDRILHAVESGLIHCLGHPLGRLIGKREPIDVDMDRIFEACATHDVCIEINCQPERLDLPEKYCRSAKDAGVMFTLGTDAHAADQFALLSMGVQVAQRGWLAKKDILNTRNITELRKWLAKSLSP
jgi:DNA polymerase (family 10)